MFLGFLGFRF